MVSVPLIKICGITNIDDALISVDYGADVLGFIFAKSLRQITPQNARKIIKKLPPFIGKVGVFVNESPHYIRKIVQECGLTEVQLHGEEIPELCGELCPLTVIKAIRVKDENDIKILSAYTSVSAFLLDSFVFDKKGGTGKKFDWKLAISAKKYGKPIILSGGLTPDNVLTAIKLVQPYAVDVCSGVETKAGKKDKKKIKEFINKARKYATK
ncbi:MAG: phosphoribosylanthranilate isomerase [Candidatus Firestonebacteria bacterium]